MKNLYLFLLAIIAPIGSITFAQCPPSSASQIIPLDNGNTIISNGQKMWTLEQSAYYQTEENGPSVFYTGGLWIGGLSADNQLKLAAAYNDNGDDFYPGPLSMGSAEVDASNCMLYDQIFTVTRAESETHLAYFESVANGTVDIDFPFGYETPSNILNYPVNGNVSLNQSPILAPFYDSNNDGVYDPTTGDFPLFAGMNGADDCQSFDVLQGDIAYFWIDNDKGNIHTQSTSSPMGIEIRNVASVFQGQGGTPMENSTFYQKKIINQGTQTFHDVYIGIFVDPNLGNPNDDYIGCNLSKNLGYVYNSDEDDETSSLGPGFGAEIPAAGIILLESGVDQQNDGLVDENMPMSSFIPIHVPPMEFGSPVTPVDYYNLMQSKWIDGTPLSYGGNGYSDGGQPTSFAYPDDYIPQGESEWTEATGEIDGGDRKFVMSVGPFDLAPGGNICIRYATVIGKPSGGQTALEALHDNTDYIIDQFDNCFATILTNIPSVEAVLGEILFDRNTNSLTINTNKQVKNEVLVVNSLGQTILSQPFSGEFTTTLNALSRGIYIVRINDVLGHIQTKKIVID